MAQCYAGLPGSKLSRRVACEWPTTADTCGCEQWTRQDRARLRMPKATGGDSCGQRVWAVTWMWGGDSKTSAMAAGADAEGQAKASRHYL
jgi:hypothetical protein